MKYEKLIFGKNKNAKNFLLFLKMSTSDEIMSISGIVVYDIFLHFSPFFFGPF